MNDSNEVGIAAEYRVMSELLLRGYRPCRPLSPKRADLILENGLKIEIKGSHHYPDPDKYIFDLTLGHGRKKPDPGFYDFMIAWCIDENIFFIIPACVIKATSKLHLHPGSDSKYNTYREAWTLLEKGR